jgi:uncharacterized protein (TIGR02270 family)
MSTSYRAFRVELYEEYLAEAAFLYSQRLTLYDNPEIPWTGITGFEERIEAYIDGLLVGGDLALEVCKRHAAEGEAGELFPIMAVLCRRGQRDLAVNLLHRLDPADAGASLAAADALKYELPYSWTGDLLALLSSDPKIAPILARVFGYRRLPCGPQLLAAMPPCAADSLVPVLWALGRIAYRPASGPLLEYLQTGQECLRSSAAIALARIGEPAAVEYCLSQSASHSWPVLPLGLAAGGRALAPLTRLSEQRSTDAIVGLGLLGDPASVPLLLSLLEREDSAPHAALALQCVTGAALFETVFVPDEPDEEDDPAQVPPDRGDGRPFGSTVTRLSQNREIWTDWWRANQDRFVSGRRYRDGAAFSPRRLVETLAADSTPHQIRQCCLEELAIRYREDLGLETDAPVRLQLETLSRAESTAARSAAFEDGAWYFGGVRM